MGRMVTTPRLVLTRISGLDPATAETAEVEEVQIRRGVDAAQRAIKRKRRQLERRLETLRQHDLENIAGGDVVLGAHHHALELVRRGIRARLNVERAGIGVGGRPHSSSPKRARGRQGASSASTTADSRSLARASAVFAVAPACGRTGVTTVMVSLTVSKATITRRPHQHRIGNAERIGTRRRQILHQPHHVVAEIAEHAGRHRRQRRGQRDAALARSARARPSSGASLTGTKAAGSVWTVRLISARSAVDAENDIRVEADDRIAAAHGAAFDRFQQKAHRRGSFGRPPATLR